MALRLVPYGPAALAVLRQTLGEAKSGQPLAPVTVAVPSNYAGLALRRALGEAGLANVRFLPLGRLAELLGAPSLADRGRRPLTGPLRAEATRAVLAAEPGVFRPIADHPSTERSLEATFRDLRLAPPAVLSSIAARSARAAHVVRLYQAFRQATAAFYDEEDCALAAAEAVAAGVAALADVGHVVLYLPRDLSPAERRLAEALARAGRLTALVGLTGDPQADELAERLAAPLEVALGPAERAASPGLPLGHQVVVAADAEEEARTALRLVMARLAAGTPLYRMAVLYRAAQPYALLAQQVFAGAGVPFNGPAIRSLGQTVPGRTLLGLLRLPEADFRRDLVMDWLTAAPVLEDPRGGPAPAQRWEAISRAAGVVRGAGQWRERLGRYAESLRQRAHAAEALDEGQSWLQRRLDEDAAQAERLADFVATLAERAVPPARASWTDYVAWARGLLERYLGGEGHRRAWPEDEIEAVQAVEAALQSLAGLAELRPEVDAPTFRRALERQLDAPARRVGRFGEGVFIGRLADAMGADFDLVIVLGVAEGVCPPVGRDDPLLPDREREAAGPDLPRRTERAAEERRDYLAALAAAPERVLVYPRADLRGQRGRLPARWLLETASALEGRPLYSADFDPPPSRPWLTFVASFEAALSGAAEAASPQEYDLRSLLVWRRSGAPAVKHYLAAETPALRAGLEAQLARRSAALTRWDGAVPARADLAPSAGSAISPTALQQWATCPFRYFLGYVLRVAETIRPEELLTLDPLTRGSLIHEVLERFLREMPPRTSPDQPWTAEERTRLAAIAETVFDQAEAAGLTGKRLLWLMERERLRRDLAGWLDADEALRRERGTVPLAVELGFGLPGGGLTAVALPLGGGRALAFRGRLDRLDASPDRTRLLVLDYKTGSAGPYRALDEDPFKGGQMLQLPVYALAAQQQAPGATVEACYWFVAERQGYERHGYIVDEARLEAFTRTVGILVDGIAAGLFPARPGAYRNGSFEHCQYCPYDRVCPPDRGRAWERKRQAPALAAYLQVAEPVA